MDQASGDFTVHTNNPFSLAFPLDSSEDSSIMLCFTNVFQVYIEMNQPVMAASLSLELGNALKVMDQTDHKR